MSKPTFLAVYDYEQGGVWLLIEAASADEISSKYPELEVVTEQPSPMSDDQLATIGEQIQFDMDDEPRGWLREPVENRYGSCRLVQRCVAAPRR